MSNLNGVEIQQVSAQVKEASTRMPWQTPKLVNLDTNSFTNGGGTSGVEGTSFLKIGS